MEWELHFDTASSLRDTMESVMVGKPKYWKKYYIGAEAEQQYAAVIRHVRIFAEKLVVKRTIHCSLKTNTLSVEDEIENQGSKTEPLMILYHMNMGYPLLSETAELWIPAATVRPRNDRAAEDLDTWGTVLSSAANFEERCYYHEYDGNQMRAQNRLKFIAPGEKKHYGVTLTMVEGSDAWNAVKNG